MNGVYCPRCRVTFATRDEWLEHEAMMEAIGPAEARSLEAAFRADPEGTKARVRSVLAYAVQRMTEGGQP